MALEVLVPAAVSPLGWGIAQYGEELCAISWCCQDLLWTNEVEDQMKCSKCMATKMGPVGAWGTWGWWMDISMANSSLIEWISAWTGLPKDQIKVELK